VIVGVLAGEGKMPRLIIDGIHSTGQKVLLLAVRDVTPQKLVGKADKIIWLHLTQMGKAIKVCEQYGVKELIMAGRFKHNNIFSLSLLHMDWTTIKEWFSLKDKRADSILGAVANAFSTRGIEIGSSIKYLEKHIAKEGTLTKKGPSKKMRSDIELGIRLAKELGRVDIGQSVVVKDGSVVALEAMEGTDRCLERAGEIAGEGCIVAKMAKPNQDMRFDVPVIGVNTIEKLHKIGAKGIVIEAGKTILLDYNVVELADEYGLFILSEVYMPPALVSDDSSGTSEV
jgi:UDP-2,3-diacylglucosamine hydrolase